MSFKQDSPVARRRAVVERYLQKRQFYPFGVTAEASSNLGLVVVVPCFDEPDIGPVLDSLASCDAPDCDVEVLVVVNAPAGAAADVLVRNAAVVSSISEFSAGRMPGWMNCYAIEKNTLPAARAGVGLARKIGMDEAASRIAKSIAGDGVIACLDADCSVMPNYLARLREMFVAHPKCPGVSIYFEHPGLFGTEDPIHRAMIDYELHLRYYVAGQRLAGFPYAFHTIGSALACKATAYAAQGGMNLRQGGEDFYFAQKLIAVGGYRVLNGTAVYPGVRASTRVPFGTGPAIQRSLESGAELKTFAPQIFQDLAKFCATLAESTPSSLPERVKGCSGALRRFLDSQDFNQKLAEISANVASDKMYRRRVFGWFNAFRFLKFAQYARRCEYPAVPISTAARELVGECTPYSARDLLLWYRRLDRNG